MLPPQHSFFQCFENVASLLLFLLCMVLLKSQSDTPPFFLRELTFLPEFPECLSLKSKTLTKITSQSLVSGPVFSDVDSGLLLFRRLS